MDDAEFDVELSDGAHWRALSFKSFGQGHLAHGEIQRPWPIPSGDRDGGRPEDLRAEIDSMPVLPRWRATC